MHLGTQHQAAEGEFNQEGGAEFTLRRHTHTDTYTHRPNINTGVLIRQTGRQTESQTVWQADSHADRQAESQTDRSLTRGSCSGKWEATSVLLRRTWSPEEDQTNCFNSTDFNLTTKDINLLIDRFELKETAAATVDACLSNVQTRVLINHLFGLGGGAVREPSWGGGVSPTCDAMCVCVCVYLPAVCRPAGVWTLCPETPGT